MVNVSHIARWRHLALFALLAAMLVPTTASAAVGTLDADWAGPTGATNAAYNCAGNGTAGTEWCVGALAVLPDGKVLVAGNIKGWNASAPGLSRLFRLDTAGNVDPSFPVVTVANGSSTGQIWTVEVSGDGTIFVGGTFLSVTVAGVTSARTGVFALSSTGELKAFDITNSLQNTPPSTSSVSIYALEPTADGGVIVGTNLLCDSAQYALCRLGRFDATGTHDASFTGSTTATSVGGPVYDIQPAPGGGYYVGGSFATYKGATAKRIVRIDADGARDTGFTAAIDDGWVYTIAVDASQRVLVGGAFTTIGGVSANGLARLTADGTLDTSPFSTTTNWGPTDGRVWSTAVDATGRIYVGGNFTSFKDRNGATLGEGIVALNPDGTKDADVTTSLGAGASGWNANLAYNTGIRRIVPTGWGVYVAGQFSQFSSVQRNNAVRLESGLKQLTVVPAGSGSGTVTSDPAGLDCGTVCSRDFAEGATVTLTATPRAGSAFTGWSGACTGTATTCTVTLTANESVTATFGSDAPTPGPNPNPAPDPKAASVKIRTSKVQPGRAIESRVTVNGPGRIVMTGTRLTRTNQTSGVACRATRVVTRASTVTVRCTFNAATRTVLRSQGQRIRIRVVFRAQNGTTVQATRVVRVAQFTPNPEPVTG